MWRIIPNFPKAFRGNWNNSVVRSAPPTSCRDDDGIDGNACQGPSPVFFIHSNLCCYRAGKRSKKKYKRRTENAALNKWIQSFKKDWSSVNSPFTLEAFGCGTMLLLGIHLSQYYTLWHDWKRRKYSDTRGPSWLSVQLSQMSLAMPVFGWEKHLKPDQVPLPGQQLSLLEQHSTQTAHELKVHQQTGRKPKEKCSELDTSFKWLNHTFKTDILKPDFENCIDDLLCEVEQNWSALNEHYVSIGRNITAYQYTQQDDMAHAVSLWHQSSSLASSSFNLGVCYQLGRGVEINLDKARQFYEAAAKQGHHKAMYNLARMYLNGDGVDQDVHRATELLKSAASAQLSKALCDLGVVYANQKDNKTKAVELFKMAAKLKDECGCYNLAVCYHTGCGVEQNLCQAAELYKEAAQLGHKEAQLMLATFFHYGLGGLPVDESSARAWLSKAETQCDELTDESFNTLENLESYFTLSLDQITTKVDGSNTKCKEQSLDSDGLATNDITTSERNVSSVNKNSTLESKTESNSTDFLASIGVTGGNFGQSILNNGTFGSFGNTTKRKTVSRQKHSQNRKLPGSHTSKNNRYQYIGCEFDMDSLCEWSIDGSDFNKDDAVSVNWTRC